MKTRKKRNPNTKYRNYLPTFLCHSYLYNGIKKLSGEFTSESINFISKPEPIDLVYKIKFCLPCSHECKVKIRFNKGWLKKITFRQSRSRWESWNETVLGFFSVGLFFSCLNSNSISMTRSTSIHILLFFSDLVWNTIQNTQIMKRERGKKIYWNCNAPLYTI